MRGLPAELSTEGEAAAERPPNRRHSRVLKVSLLNCGLYSLRSRTVQLGPIGRGYRTLVYGQPSSDTYPCHCGRP